MPVIESGIPKDLADELQIEKNKRFAEQVLLGPAGGYKDTDRGQAQNQGDNWAVSCGAPKAIDDGKQEDSEKKHRRLIPRLAVPLGSSQLFKRGAGKKEN